MPEKFAISAGIVVPMNAPPMEDSVVIVEDGRIADIVERKNISDGIPVEDHPEAILMPALVNAHTHLVYTAFRGLADDVDFYEWITGHIFPLGIDKREDEFRDSARTGITECFRNGITAIGEQHYTMHGLEAMRSLGMKGVYFYEVFGMGTLNLSRSIERDRKLITELSKETTEKIRIGIAPHAPYSVTPSMGRMVAEVAAEFGLPISVHIAETRDEVELFLKGEGRLASVRRMSRIPKPDGNRTPLKYFQELGLLNEIAMIVHGIYLSYKDLNKIKDFDTSMITCPTSNAKLGAGIARAGAWKNHGLNISIATDSPASGETFDLFEEMRRFVLLQRGITGETDSFSAEEIVRMVTVNPAKALGISGMVGDLRKGSCADMILLKSLDRNPESQRDVYGTILWDCKSSDIACVWADGRKVYER